jgi:hypothetical protein
MDKKVNLVRNINELQELIKKPCSVLQLCSNILYILLTGRWESLSRCKVNNYEKREKELKNRMKMIWESTLSEIFYNTEPVNRQRNFYKLKGENVEVGKELYSSLELDKIAQDVITYNGKDSSELRGICSGDISRLLKVKKENIDIYLHLGEFYWSKFALKAILFSLFFRTIFQKVYGKRFKPITMWDSNDNPIYFDGKIEMGYENIQFYLSILSAGHIGTTTMHDLGVDLLRIPTSDERNALVFVPYYPNPELLQAELYWKTVRKVNLRVLYLQNFFEIFRIWEREHIIKYLNQEAIS